MHLRILLPFRIFAERTDVSRIVAETREGSFGLLPHRLDCVAALAPGFSLTKPKPRARFIVAVDEGVLVKTGSEVLVSVRHAIGGTDLGQLHEAVKREFLTLDERRAHVRDLRSRKLEEWLYRPIRGVSTWTMSVDESPVERGDGFRQASRREGGPKLKVQREGTQGVWFGLGMSGLDRLVGSGADDPWRHARPLVGPAPSGSPFLDAHAAGCRTVRWVRECLALGRPTG